MVEELLVGNNLTDDMKLSGKKLVEILDNSGFPISGALWIYQSDYGRWIFYLATSEVIINGPKKAYKKLSTILEKNKDLNIRLINIQILDESDMFIRLLKTAFKTENSITGIRVSGSSIAGMYIDDAYIYRLV